MTKKNKITAIIIGLVLLAFVLLFPVTLYAKDGGTVTRQAILYSYTNKHTMNDNADDGYVDGVIIEILGIEVYNTVEDVPYT